MKLIQSLKIPSLVFVASLIFGVSCEKKGPAEKAGENIDNAMEEVSDGVKDATN